ncbi:MAG TPA: glutamate 5-kinase [Polyangiaceae bacterium]|nr:glutamate 5-kinase [Polyangiaceae bacterium]
MTEVPSDPPAPAASSRSELAQARRIVVKIGSRALAGDTETPHHLAEQIAAAVQGKRACVLVSSGAIAIGCARLGYKQRPKEMARLQAAAAAGQSVLMRRYDEAFAAFGMTAAQVLLTHADLADRERLNNAREAFAALLEAGAVPIVNENDTVATDEIRFGDNDQLAAMVTPLVGAELLVLLTDMEGVLGPDGKRISTMTDQTEIGQVASNAERVGSGGISSKLDAARKGCRAGANVVIAKASHPNVLSEVLNGADVGTFFPRSGPALRARKHWIAFTLRPRGTILLDGGAAAAMAAGKSSLLPVGVLGVRGQFDPGDSVRLVAPDGSEVARGLTRLGALDVARSAGKKGRELDLLFGIDGSDVIVVHKDDLVVAT